MNIDNLNPVELQSLHQVFLTEGFEILNTLLEETFKGITEGAIKTDSSADMDIQAMNQIRGFYSALQVIQDLKNEVSLRVNETQQSLFSQRDTHNHPCIAEGSMGKETFLGGL